VETNSSANAHGSLGRVVPRLLLVICLADIGLRLERVDPLTFRAWEALTTYRPPGAPFERNRRYYNARSYGDLAAMGNLPALRQYRPEAFTTDPLGFRNPGDVASGPVAAIVVGDSFAVGSAVNDDENLTTRLSALMGCRLYNAGGIDPHPDRILALARQLDLRGNLVIHEYNEDFEMPAVPTERRRRLQRAMAWMNGWVGGPFGRARGILTVSPLEILCEQALKKLENGRILPNQYSGAVVRGRLANGDQMLFRRSWVDGSCRKKAVPLAYWKWLQEELEAGGLQLVVVITPSKYRVYRRFVVEPRGLPEGAGDYVDRAEAELRAAGIPVINLTATISASAAQHLKEGSYLYWRDDVHWNAHGIEIGAAAIHEGLVDYLRCSPPNPPAGAGAEASDRARAGPGGQGQEGPVGGRKECRP